MHIASALSTLTSAPALAQDVEGQLKATMTRSPDLLLVFVSYAMVDSFQKITEMLRESIRPAHFLAVAAESILGADQEVERSPAVSALALTGPENGGATFHTFHLDEDEWQELLTDDEVLANRLASGDPGELRSIIMLADPFSTPIVQLLEACSRRFPGAPVIGGMASGMSEAGDTRLALDDEIYSSGAIGVTLGGDIEVDCVISQGCRPIGRALVVTRSQNNMIEQLDGKPALGVVEEMITKLPLHDRQLLDTGGPQVGLVIDPGKGNYGPGDFLIRSLIGVKRETGALLISDLVRAGQRVQFHVRDAKTADEEMRLLLEGESLLAPATAQPAGALLITCNGRGTRLFDAPHHDIALTRKVLGAIPVAGFFAAGELGPIGEKSFIHAHTAALAVFRTPEQKP